MLNTRKVIVFYSAPHRYSTNGQRFTNIQYTNLSIFCMIFYFHAQDSSCLKYSSLTALFNPDGIFVKIRPLFSR